MMMIIPCTQCHCEGQFDLHLTFTYRWSTCNLSHGHSNEWTFYFCNIKCMTDWLELLDIKNKGIPCQSCHNTGWLFGFEQNGVCDVCDGTLRVLACQNK